MMAVDIDDAGGSLKIGEPRRLFRGDYIFDSANPYGRTYAVALDGRFLMILAEPRSVWTRLDVVLNWFEVLRDRVGQ